MAVESKASDRQVFLETVAHRRPARIPYHFWCTPDLAQRLAAHVGGDGDWFRHYGCLRNHTLSPVRKAGTSEPDYSRYWKGHKMPPGSWVNHLGVLEVPSGTYHLTGYVSPLREAASLDEIGEYPIVKPSEFDWSHFPAEVEKARQEGVPASIFVGHMYENSWQIRGYEQFLEDMVERPEWAHYLLERFFEWNLHAAVEAARAGVDQIQCGDDVANQFSMMFSLPMWREFILSRWAKVWKAIEDIRPDTAIYYHTDGNAIAIVPEMVEAGLTILNPVQPECIDTDAIFEKWGTRLCFDGCIGTQTTMPFGTPAQVRERVRECVDKYGQKGGLILSPTHTLEPEVPIANIEAFVEACREYGSAP